MCSLISSRSVSCRVVSCRFMSKATHKYVTVTTHKPCAYLPVNGVHCTDCTVCTVAGTAREARKIPHGTKNTQPPEGVEVRYTPSPGSGVGTASYIHTA